MNSIKGFTTNEPKLLDLSYPEVFRGPALEIEVGVNWGLKAGEVDYIYEFYTANPAGYLIKAPVSECRIVSNEGETPVLHIKNWEGLVWNGQVSVITQAQQQKEQSELRTKALQLAKESIIYRGEVVIGAEKIPIKILPLARSVGFSIVAARASGEVDRIDVCISERPMDSIMKRMRSSGASTEEEVALIVNDYIKNLPVEAYAYLSMWAREEGRLAFKHLRPRISLEQVVNIIKDKVPELQPEIEKTKIVDLSIEGLLTFIQELVEEMPGHRLGVLVDEQFVQRIMPYIDLLYVNGRTRTTQVLSIEIIVKGIDKYLKCLGMVKQKLVEA